MKQLAVTCPNCKKKFNYYSSEFRPFCSEKCRLIDLGQWLTESYTVPVEKLTEEEIQTLEELVHEKNAEEEKKHHH
ncbi:DNA gyrase inhibitor YacG [Peredibacter starrii]|uniref:DNA gyrase inhibitor YacG n=1 Tax=Peredibacter starrii TaxID=28202 RepID=A0AAX4HMW5_9BACT|nr:DNA gyrase inhibitor YacG [Peredibacter starrii]WPU64619.1 DNA gyrase inhibitor YacG [Peredibacter starrii]